VKIDVIATGSGGGATISDGAPSLPLGHDPRNCGREWNYEDFFEKEPR
jgi:hypothetical protein